MKLKLSFLQIINLSAALLCGISTAHASLGGLKNVTGPVFVIVIENKSWSLIKGSNDAPYINSLLTNPQASYARNYNNPPGLHPSELNYIWMEAGSNYGITDDNDPTHPTEYGVRIISSSSLRRPELAGKPTRKTLAAPGVH